MKFYKARVINIIQSDQRDESFIEELQEYLGLAIKGFGQENYNRIRKLLPLLTATWYYSLTSLSSLQTLGEEYTGIIRLKHNQISSKYLQFIWLIFYIGGEQLVNRVLEKFENQVSKSKSLQTRAKAEIIRNLTFLRLNKDLFYRLHCSLFYINGKYHNISNRITGIEYVFLRQWMQHDAATSNIKLLGVVSLLYVMYDLIKIYMQQKITINENISCFNNSTKICTLCVESCKSICATFCGHLFCWQCIYDSLKYQQSCPVCREPIHSSRIIFLQNYH